MAQKITGNSLSGWAFLIGVLIAIVLGFIGNLNPTWLFILVIIGLVVGLLNVTGREMQPFLMSGAVLIIASAFGSSAMSSIPRLAGVFDALLTIFVPATIIVAIKNAFYIARN